MMINNKTPNLENRQFYNFHCCFDPVRIISQCNTFTQLLSLVSASLGSNSSIFSNKPSLVEPRRKHVPQKGPENRDKESILILFQTPNEQIQTYKKKPYRVRVIDSLESTDIIELLF